jgi:hypothetical protein
MTSPSSQSGRLRSRQATAGGEGGENVTLHKIVSCKDLRKQLHDSRKRRVTRLVQGEPPLRMAAEQARDVVDVLRDGAHVPDPSCYSNAAVVGRETFGAWTSTTWPDGSLR